MEPRALDADLLLQAYAAGVFPMAESRDDPTLFWVDPMQRGVFDLDRFHISRSLARHLRRCPHRVTVDRAFDAVIDACADRPETWINPPLAALYRALFTRGAAHSIEVWQDGQLAGGVFGLTIGAAFFGESMFSLRTNGSKTALSYLVDRLRVGGFLLFDTQFLTPHLASLGAQEIPRSTYRSRLATAIAAPADFYTLPETVTAQEVLQRRIHAS